MVSFRVKKGRATPRIVSLKGLIQNLRRAFPSLRSSLRAVTVTQANLAFNPWTSGGKSKELKKKTSLSFNETINNQIYTSK